MGNVFGGQKQTPDEIKQLRQARIDYQDYLNTAQTNTNADVNKKAITPESASAILAKIQESFKWLQSNPNANLNEIFSSRDATAAEIKRILSTEKPKREFQNILTALPTIAETNQQKKILDEKQVNDIRNLVSTEKKWYEKHQQTASTVDFSQERMKIQDTIQLTVKDSSASGMILQELKTIMDKDTADVTSEVLQQQLALKKAESQEVNVRKGINTALETALLVFFIFLVVVVCGVSGMFAANFAIGRAPVYRILYFIYGFIPIFMPFVLIYTAYRRIKDGPLPLYAILPLSVEPAVTRFGQYLWYPFYWIPNDQAVKMADDFTNAVKALEST